MAMYTDTKAKVITPEWVTIEFLNNLGILQSDTPFIILLALDFILHLAVTDVSPDFFVKDILTLKNVEFADDIAVLLIRYRITQSYSSRLFCKVWCSF